MLKIVGGPTQDGEDEVPIVDLGVYRKGDDIFVLQRDGDDFGGLDEFVLVPLNRIASTEGGDMGWLDREELRETLRDGFEYIPTASLVIG